MTDLTPQRLAEIKALAEKALSFGVRSSTDAFLAHRDYQHALSPDVVLALVAEIERLRVRLARIQPSEAEVEELADLIDCALVQYSDGDTKLKVSRPDFLTEKIIAAGWRKVRP